MLTRITIPELEELKDSLLILSEPHGNNFKASQLIEALDSLDYKNKCPYIYSIAIKAAENYAGHDINAYISILSTELSNCDPFSLFSTNNESMTRDEMINCLKLNGETLSQIEIDEIFKYCGTNGVISRAEFESILSANSYNH